MNKLDIKTFFILLFMGISFLSYGTTKDFIVLLDTSESMFDYYDDVVKVFMSDALKQHLRIRDEFHLISFSEKPELEIVKKIERPSDVDPILRRLLLLQPLGKQTDLVNAVNFLESYTAGLPPNRPKTLIILSDGINNPPSEKGITPEEAQTAITQSFSSFRSKGWTVVFIRVPPLPVVTSASKGPIQSGTDQILDLRDISSRSGVQIHEYAKEESFTNQALGSPLVTFPTELGVVGNKFNFPLQFENLSKEEKLIRLREVLFQGKNVLTERISVSLPPGEKKDVQLPLKFSTNPNEGQGTGDFTLVFDDGNRAYPTEATVQWSFDPQLNFNFIWLYWILGIILGFVVVVLVFLVIRHLLHVGQSLADQGVHTLTKDPISKSLGIRKQEENPARYSTMSIKNTVLKTKDPNQTLPALDKNELKNTISSDIKPTQKSPDKPVLKTSIKDDLEPDTKSTSVKEIKIPEIKLPPVPSVRGISEASRLPISHGAPKPFKERISRDIRQKTFFLDIWTPDQIHQNTMNLSNIVSMKPGDFKHLGPGNSEFKIFLRTIKKPVAEILFDGNELSLRPLGDFFPDIKFEELYNCTDKVLKLELSPGGSYLFMQFSVFTSKEEELKRSLYGLPIATRKPF